MHLVCKFIPSSKLSSNELSYVLTPDECIGQLSRVRNSEDILRNLPKELAQKISISAKKSSSGLLTAIRHELGNGNWVALSSFSRRTPLTDTQLQSFPRLKAQLESVSSTGESKVYKAGYKQVKDDVTLVRSYTHVPSEPSPDQKIVVEFAGQWSSNAACLMLGKTEAQKEKVTVGKADTENKHRSLATFKDLEAEGKTLYIKIPCSDQPQPILLKLAEDLQPVDKETQMDEWDNVLVPVRPLAYLDGSNDKAKASDLRGGFLYVFWKGKLWREMAINEKGYYQDVDVEYYRTLEQEEKKKDTPQVIQRSASGFAMAHFWAPYKISGEVQQGESGLKIIFSPKQKRFAQIEALESDAALLEKSSTPLDELSSYSDAQSFSAKEFTSDVDSAAIHKVSEDDMPWLSDQQAIVRSYDQSNTVIAYVDGKNSGLLFRVDVGTSGITALNSLYVIDHNSDYKDVFDLEFYEGEDHDWQQALLSGLPSDGVFTMSLVHDQDPDSRHILFDRVAYNDLFVEPESATEHPLEAQPNDKPKGLTTEEKQRFESLVLDWSL
ncbi:hypothetical protein GUA36_23910 [Vibrio parahaemolyticus]|uniref:hypothetical protein n=1 Tax=Vibrio parahaemolyticus TaxID=670 RepID=UPI0004A4A38B|nr:hypothetical protein [Vibrio parahaemolyticus]EGQ8161770.1 hypothetical protein [Vibrio parahaemolyticus]EGQ8292111.1 hypothetical protein [Vibrio parahaemolyticus]EGQ8328482.1 hypothetical protein [Vibrio parahaemolyticus]EGQ8354911.1 hypothetical protein [Vibrio parahaemolyticus]EGQ8408483.1 hypothetical protein [Vibrio parahaemolyticus]